MRRRYTIDFKLKAIETAATFTTIATAAVSLKLDDAMLGRRIRIRSKDLLLSTLTSSRRTR
ncbi:hypothetical protein HDU97_010307 [Phlyctochytrium planicorne]|nr:hypothetical protein HDU97_010307 [Phlyctochytrium planicorne]